MVLPPPPDLRSTLLAAWKTNNRVTVSLVAHLPVALWEVAVPGAPRRTIRAIAAHLHNARCMWVKTLGREHGIPAPLRVDHRRVARRELVAALKRSSDGIEALLKLGLARLGRLEPRRPVIRYERRRPGALVHLDVKKLGRIGRIGHRIHGDWRRRVRGIGWEYVHVAIDDRTRLAYAEIYPDETAASATAFLGRAVRWFARWGVQVRAVMTDNGSGFRGYRFAAGRRQLRLRHLRTRPYSPQTNGKAERFIRTALTEWAYVQPYRTSLARASALTDFLRYYNRARPHSALGYRTPAQRLTERP